jgi:hypothetical protein
MDSINIHKNKVLNKIAKLYNENEHDPWIQIEG